MKLTKHTARKKKYFAKLIETDDTTRTATFEVIGDYRPEPAAFCLSSTLGGSK